jgi:hypothetical protein
LGLDGERLPTGLVFLGSLLFIQFN